MRHELVIANRTTELRYVDRWLEQIATAGGFSDRDRFALDLVLNEAILNIINYGYDDDSEQQIRIQLEEHSTHFELMVEDSARPFDPLKDIQPLEEQDLEHAVIGGRGIRLIKHYCNQYAYAYRDAKNQLLLHIAKSCSTSNE